MFDETGYLVKIGKLYLQMPPKGDEHISEYSLVFTSNAYEAIKYKSYGQAKKLADVFGGTVTRLETHELLSMKPMRNKMIFWRMHRCWLTI